MHAWLPKAFAKHSRKILPSSNPNPKPNNPVPKTSGQADHISNLHTTKIIAIPTTINLSPIIMPTNHPSRPILKLYNAWKESFPNWWSPIRKGSRKSLFCSR
ncbi:hypothetical protein PVL29_026016 [Vitis rotundifolia]|uniref:Uncharacterized protein n=1 Tax=Vitis rotundifolia TaxID=103349 RepID=A0AA38YLE9_VITRO|nr:hypothetical protein PVL29_026016 [Vitis rotundifolia]